MQGSEKRSSTVAGVAMRAGTIAAFVVLQAVLLFGGAGRLNSMAVRIQDERGHAVCSNGPYRYVRHPGYVGYALQYRAMPFRLGSLWALLPWLAAAVSMVIRTALEDRMLHAELPGYPEYAQQVRWRLIPRVW